MLLVYRGIWHLSPRWRTEGLRRWTFIFIRWTRVLPEWQTGNSTIRPAQNGSAIISHHRVSTHLLRNWEFRKRQGENDVIKLFFFSKILSKWIHKLILFLNPLKFKFLCQDYSATIQRSLQPVHLQRWNPQLEAAIGKFAEKYQLGNS